MWSETDLDSEQFVSEHLLTGTNSRPKENGDYHHHSLDPVDPMMGPGGHNHLLRHEMLSDAMLGHVSSGEGGGLPSGLHSLHSLHSRDRDQVKWAPHQPQPAQAVSCSAAQPRPVPSVIKLSVTYRAKCTHHAPSTLSTWITWPPLSPVTWPHPCLNTPSCSFNIQHVLFTWWPWWRWLMRSVVDPILAKMF